MRRRFATLAVASLGLAGCAGDQTMMGGEGADGANFVQLFLLFLAVCAAIYLLVIVALAAALTRGRDGDMTNSLEQGRADAVSAVPRPALIAWGAIIFVGLTALTVASFLVDRANAANAVNPRMHITVTGNQWWWNVQYDSSNPSRSVRTANEIHLPLGVPVEVSLRSNDVIHSFWVPNLAGKQDLIPGRDTDIQLLPRRVGRFRGQCAEFCGAQHAHMALDVIVEPLADFRRWYAKQLIPAPAPRTPLQMAGLNYFVTRECSACHSVAGTPANGTIGPDLSHVASRPTIAAGTLPMNRGNLYGWVADPQSQKPGNKMPTVGLEPQQLHALVAYLETLK